MADALDMSLDDLITKNKPPQHRRARRNPSGGGGGPTPTGRRFHSRAATRAAAAPYHQLTFQHQAPAAYGYVAQPMAMLAAPSASGIDTPTKLYISSLDYNVSNEDIKELFSEVGDVKHRLDSGQSLELVGPPFPSPIPSSAVTMPPRRNPRRHVVMPDPEPEIEESEERSENEEFGEQIDEVAEEMDYDDEEEEEEAPANPFEKMTALRYKRRRFHDQFTEDPNSDDPRFHTRFQEDVYNWIYLNKNFASHTWFRWRDVDKKREYPGLHALFSQIGLADFVVLRQYYSTKLIKQFYATLFIDGDFQIIRWRTGTENYIASRSDFAHALGVVHLLGEAKIHDELELSVQEKLAFYQPGFHGLPGPVTGLYTIPSVVHRFIKSTIYPRMGNKDQVRHRVWNIMAHVMRGQPFDVIDCIIREMHESKGDKKVKGVYYAPHIMKLLLATVPDLVGEYLDEKHMCYTPRERNPVVHPVPGAAPPVPLQQPQQFLEQAPYEFGVPPSQYTPFMGALVSHFQRLSTTMGGMAEREIARDQMLRGMREDLSHIRQGWHTLESRVTDLEEQVEASSSSRRRRHRCDLAWPSGDPSGPSSSH